MTDNLTLYLARIKKNRLWRQQNLCKHCGGQMGIGDYIAQTSRGYPDFPGDNFAVTLSPGGPGRLVKGGCLKCRGCGWSVVA